MARNAFTYTALGLAALLAAVAGGNEPGHGSPVARSPQAGPSFTLADFSPPTERASDATPAFMRLFDAVRAAGGGTVLIPPGTYSLSGTATIPLSSHTRVIADAATFQLPAALGDKARVTLFAGEDVEDFSWHGGHFQGHCFDPNQEHNPWEPNVLTRCIVLSTTPQGRTRTIRFRDIRSDGIAGAVVSVFGATPPGSEDGIRTFAEDVSIENCTLLTSGKFMWDYGYLWQIIVWPEDYADRDRALAARYFTTDCIRAGLRAASGADAIRFDNATRPLPVAKTDGPKDALVFYGDALPKNIMRGRQYFVIDSQPDSIKVADKPGGQAIVFDGDFGPQAKLIHDHFRAYLALYAPVGSGPGKGAFDLVACKGVRVQGCTLSARGDTMHIQRCHDVVFTGNRITGSRMGAFFLAEYCRNAAIVGNTVDGTNGSRVMSVEKSCTDVTITGNTFRHGGRGSWINQPQNFVLTGNAFLNNTTKCERDPRRGRRSFRTGDYEVYPELYFTLHRPDGRYGTVIVSDNVFDTGPECDVAISFATAGKGLLVRGNVFRGGGRRITVEPGCEDVLVADNLGAE